MRQPRAGQAAPAPPQSREQVAAENPQMTGQMNSERDPEEVEEELESEDEDDTLKVRRSGEDEDDEVDAVSDMSAEINIEELVSKLDATDDDDIARRRAIKRRIEELRELRDAERDLESTYNFDFEDDESP
jgi:hypothetical protein